MKYALFILSLAVNTCNSHFTTDVCNDISCENGYVIYNSMQDRQKYFVPYEGHHIERIEEAYRQNLLGTGFYFLSNNRLDLDLAKIHNYTIANTVSNEKLNMILGKSIITPVNIIFQKDSVKNNSAIIDTIFIGNTAETIKINISNPNVDILKFRHTIR